MASSTVQSKGPQTPVLISNSYTHSACGPTLNYIETSPNYKGLSYLTISASAEGVCTAYLKMSYLCTIWSILQQESPWEVSGMAGFSTLNVNQHIWASGLV